MTSTKRPTLLFVHGAWHGSWTWGKLERELTARGWATRTVDLPSALTPDAPTEPTPGMYDDARVIRAALDSIDGPVVVVAHSYGGVPVTQATGGAGNVAHIVYLAAYQLDVGEALLPYHGVPVPESVEGVLPVVDPSIGRIPLPYFYGGVEAAEAEEAAARLVPQSLRSFHEVVTEAGWRSIPSSYIVTERDQALPAAVQEQLATRAQAVHRLDSHHSPMLSMAGELASLLVTIAQDARTATAGSREPTPITAGAVAELAAVATGPVLRPADEGYAAECAGYNLAVPHRPALVVGATNPADVQAAVRFAAAHDLPVAVLATGHSALPSAGAVLITTRRMNAVSIDAERRTARIGAGVRWQQVIDEAAKHGLAPLNGSAPTVGAVSYTLGGGLSPIGRTFGYAADHVRAIELVTADGELRRVTAESEPELFWALRGGKGNFGVVTALEFGLFPVARIYGGGLFFPGEFTAEVLRTWSSWTVGLPDEMTSSVALLQLPPAPDVPEPLRGRFVVHVRMAYVGSAQEGARLVEPLRAIGPALIDSVTEMPYAAIGSVHNDPPMPIPFSDRSTLLREFTPALADTIIELAGPASQSPLAMLEIRHLGGALDRRPEPANAVDTRGSAYLLYGVAIGGPDQAEAAGEYLTRLIADLGPWSTGRRFVNFFSAVDAAPEGVRTGYRPESYERLVAVKRRFDPRNLFRVNHNIPPA
ncbi:alpha/beta fold hydrolase [Micromonospora mirobrigensis]|uniref:FAD/FMN-containing dehydrogenase n=1 Tax=Micromonospora mirobrigensis TaxID=262898 RepID=A0A1C5AKC5_9ACTN|nr:alpha/beta fold hydrolase [Micromonospora mirobrigensis]SCF45675.1 FAD/FMN-containing dehydrogenase [Micromonospora mirobrigensis]